MTAVTKLRRPIPTAETLAKRKAILRSLRDLPAVPAGGTIQVGLNQGNSKTGKSGTKFKTVFVWNIPAVITCPGASQLCLQHCYNGDDRKEIFPIDLWNQNLSWFKNRPRELAKIIQTQLNGAKLPCAVRIHSSGDFFSQEYITFWLSIAEANPLISFWAYTRSWIKPELRQRLELLKTLANVELFASWDISMPPSPDGWRTSVVTYDPSEWTQSELLKKRMFLCPEQFGDVENCASCGLCMKRATKGVVFTLH